MRERREFKSKSRERENDKVFMYPRSEKLAQDLCCGTFYGCRFISYNENNSGEMS